MARDPFRNFNQYKIDPLSEIRNAGIITNGDVFWVSSVSDDQHRVRTDEMGNSVVKLTVQDAVDAAKTDNNDYILVVPTDGGTVRPLGTAIDVNEDRLHIIGLGATPAPQAYNGLTFEGYVAATGIDTEMVSVTGAGVHMEGLKFLGTSGTAALGTMTAIMTVGTAASGTPHDLSLVNMHLENTQAAAASGTADILNVSGDVAGGIQGLYFEKSWFGNWNWAPEAVVQFGGTAGPTRFKFKDCTFVTDAQATTDDIVNLGTGVTEYGEFENCKFINVEAGTAPASAITGALLLDNPVLAWDCKGANVTAIGTDTELLVTPTQAGTAGAGLHNPNIAFVGSAGIVVA